MGTIETMCGPATFDAKPYQIKLSNAHSVIYIRGIVDLERFTNAILSAGGRRKACPDHHASTQSTNVMSADDSEEDERRKLTALDGLSRLSRGNIALCQPCIWRFGASKCAKGECKQKDGVYLCRKDGVDCELYTVAGENFAERINTATATGTDTVTQVNRKTWHLIVANGVYIKLNVNVGMELDKAAETLLTPGTTITLTLGGVVCQVYSLKNLDIMIQPTISMLSVDQDKSQSYRPAFQIVYQNY